MRGETADADEAADADEELERRAELGSRDDGESGASFEVGLRADNELSEGSSASTRLAIRKRSNSGMCVRLSWRRISSVLTMPAVEPERFATNEALWRDMC